jgi:hypothetical protein
MGANIFLTSAVLTQRDYPTVCKNRIIDDFHHVFISFSSLSYQNNNKSNQATNSKNHKTVAFIYFPAPLWVNLVEEKSAL